MTASGIGALLAVVLLAQPAQARDYAGPPLTAEERARALGLFDASAERIAEATAAFARESPFIVGKRYLADASPAVGVGRAVGQRLAILRHFHYRKNGIGITIRTVFGLESGELLAIVAKAHEPTPLAPEELATAKRLVLANHPQRVKRFGETQDFEGRVLVPLLGDRRSAQFGHRLVDMRFGEPDPAKGAHRARVDLSTETVDFFEQD